MHAASMLQINLLALWIRAGKILVAFAARRRTGRASGTRQGERRRILFAIACDPPRSGDTILSPLRGFQFFLRRADRGLKPTAKLCRRCAAETLHYQKSVA